MIYIVVKRDYHSIEVAFRTKKEAEEWVEIKTRSPRNTIRFDIVAVEFYDKNEGN